MRKALVAFAAAVHCLSAAQAVAQGQDDPPAKGIQDNSFLVEEAYNQEPGVVQHLANLRRTNRDWNLTFTQEWPLGSQTHQVSYTVPFSWVRTDGQRTSGPGDVALNYRFQALDEGDRMPAFAPRLSLVLPTGDKGDGLGQGTLGYQVNLPVSKILSDRITVHANAGSTFFPDTDGRNPISQNLGGSGIFAVTRDFNLMLETIGEWTETVDASREINREFSALVSPGFRRAFNLAAGQLVLGTAVPIGLTRTAPDWGVLFYLSFEHGFVR